MTVMTWSNGGDYKLVERRELTRLRLSDLTYKDAMRQRALAEDERDEWEARAKRAERLLDEYRFRDGDAEDAVTDRDYMADYDEACDRTTAGVFTRMNETFRERWPDDDWDDEHPCDPDCPCECSATLEECAPSRPHESLIWAIFYATASGATEDPFGCADRDLETWRSRWPEDEAE